MLHNIIRNSNRVWYAMYYDHLIEKPEYQISIMQNADRLYFNCAHTLKTSDLNVIQEIEDSFKKHNIPPAFYIDNECPFNLKEMLIQRGYEEVPAEQENWYAFDCANGKNIQEEVNKFQIANPQLECIMVSPLTQSSVLNQFLELNKLVNKIEPNVLQKLAQNLITPKNKDIQFMCAIVQKGYQIVSCGLISIYKNYAYLAEGATHPNFQRQGIYSWLRRIGILYAIKQGCRGIMVNCDEEAYSNNAYQNLGFKFIGQRDFYINIQQA